jgi:hypothetical protein
MPLLFLLSTLLSQAVAAEEEQMVLPIAVVAVVQAVIGHQSLENHLAVAER